MTSYFVGNKSQRPISTCDSGGKLTELCTKGMLKVRAAVEAALDTGTTSRKRKVLEVPA